LRQYPRDGSQYKEMDEDKTHDVFQK